MPAASLPCDERERLQELAASALLDTGREFFFDECVNAVQQRLSVPIALVTLVDADRQWFKASIGLGVAETPRACAFCAYAILDDAPLVVENARTDPRFSDNILVTDAPRIMSYIGAPIIVSRGARIGTICAIDTQPRAWTKLDIAEVAEVARMAASYIPLRRGLLQKDRQRYLDFALNGGYRLD